MNEDQCVQAVQNVQSAQIVLGQMDSFELIPTNAEKARIQLPEIGIHGTFSRFLKRFERLERLKRLERFDLL